MSLTNFELITLCKIFKIKLNGVFLKDQLSNPQWGNYIINLASSNDGTGGTHWVGLQLGPGGSFYFDSYGAPPPKEVDAFIKQAGSTCSYNNWIIQDLDSHFCGFFCIGFFHYLAKHNKLPINEKSNNFINLFEDDTKSNDMILKRYFLALRDNIIVNSKLLRGIIRKKK
jgi:hypothetical protein